MRLGIVRGLLVSCAVVAAVGLTPSAALADTASGADYGEHVTCAAQMMGFDGVHNPGMHTGYAGWGDMHDCPH